MCLSATALSAEIRVSVTHAKSDTGQIGCGLYSSAEGFPMNNSFATQLWRTPLEGNASCHFRDLPAGTYALACVHDKNMNGKTDTNFLGIPKERWGVSNDVRPRLRAPKWEEAQFELSQEQVLSLAIELDK
jgi:uncharacterized protein (DUF2141 family)